MNNNERLAEIISSKLVEKHLVKEDNSVFKTKLSAGTLKEIDWKFLIEDAISISDETQSNTNEIQQIDETE